MVGSASNPFHLYLLENGEFVFIYKSGEQYEFFFRNFTFK